MGKLPKLERNFSLTGELLGEYSNLLAGVQASGGNNDVSITFDRPQLGAGFYLVNLTGNLDCDETVTFYRGVVAVGAPHRVLPSAGEQFVGWHDSGGVTSVRVTSDAIALVDNVTWGVDVAIIPLPPALY